MTARRAARALPDAEQWGTLLQALADPDAPVWADADAVAALCTTAGVKVDLAEVADLPANLDPCYARFRAVRYAYALTFDLTGKYPGPSHAKMRAAGIWTGHRNPFACRLHYPARSFGLIVPGTDQGAR